MKKPLFSFSLMVMTAGVFAQAPAIEWEKNFGGTGDDLCSDIRQTSDGGYILGGRTYSNDGDISGNHGGWDGWVVKTSSTGSLEWQKALGGAQNDMFFQVLGTPDGGYILAGLSGSSDGNVSMNHGSDDGWLVKLSSTGSIQWEKSFGGSGDEGFKGMALTSDGGYILAAYSRSDDGDVTGHHGSTTNYDYWVVKVASNGNMEWQKSIGGTDIDRAYSIIQTSDGGYLVGGDSKSSDGDATNNQGDRDCWVVKLSSTGNIQWENSMGGSEFDAIQDIIQTTDGGYIFVGHSGSNDGDVTGHHGVATVYDTWVAKLSSTGIVDWQKSLGGSDEENGYRIRQTNNGGYVIVSFSRSNDGDVTGHHGAVGSRDYWLTMLTTNGTIDWQQSYGGTNGDYGHGLDLTSDGGIVMAGATHSNDGDVGSNHNLLEDVWIVKLEGTLSVNSLNSESSIVVSPNPATNNITIKGADIARAEVYDATGKLVLSAEHTNTLSLGSLSKGMYMIKLDAEDGKESYSSKVIKE